VLGTFHSIGGRILRSHANRALNPISPCSIDDQVRLLKQLLQADNIDDKPGRPDARWISTAGKIAG